MTALEQLVASLRTAHVRLEVVDGRLRVDAPAGLLTPADRAALVAHRDELIARLRAVDSHDQPDLPDHHEQHDHHDQDHPDHRDQPDQLDDHHLPDQHHREQPAPDWLVGEEAARAITEALGPDAPGWIRVRCRALGGTEVVFVLNDMVQVPPEHAGLTTYSRDELTVIVAQQLAGHELQALHQAKVVFNGRITPYSRKEHEA